MNAEIMLENAKRLGIKTFDTDDNEIKVRGSAFIRNLSCEVVWKEEDRERGLINKYSSILSKLGWQWEKHWNVYTEEAPFGLMLSELFEFLRSCIETSGNTPAYVEWGWDVDSFYLINIRPAEDHLWHRCLVEISPLEYDREIIKEVLGMEPRNKIEQAAKWDSQYLFCKETPLIIKDDKVFINGDLFCYIFKIAGVAGRIGNSPKIKFNIFQFAKSVKIRHKIIKSKLFAEISNLNFERTIWEDTGEDINK